MLKPPKESDESSHAVREKLATTIADKAIIVFIDFIGIYLSFKICFIQILRHYIPLIE